MGLPDQFPVIVIRKLSRQSTLHLTGLGTSSRRATSLRASPTIWLKAEINQRLVILASDGVTNSDELRREVLASFPLA